MKSFWIVRKIQKESLVNLKIEHTRNQIIESSIIITIKRATCYNNATFWPNCDVKCIAGRWRERERRNQVLNTDRNFFGNFKAIFVNFLDFDEFLKWFWTTFELLTSFWNDFERHLMPKTSFWSFSLRVCLLLSSIKLQYRRSKGCRPLTRKQSPPGTTDCDTKHTN